MKKIEQLLLNNIFTRGIIYIIIGLLFIILPSNQIMKLLYFIIGSMIILISIYPLIESSRNLQFKENYLVFMFSLILVICGIILIVNPTKMVLSLTVIFLVILPLYNIYKAKNKDQQFKIEFSKLIVGLLIIIVGFEEVINFVLVMVGIIFVIIGIYNIILAIKLEA